MNLIIQVLLADLCIGFWVTPGNGQHAETAISKSEIRSAPLGCPNR